MWDLWTQGPFARLCFLTPEKKAKLNGYTCSIPSIDDAATSLNEAFQKLAAVFETDRCSNAGNVFDLTFLERNVRLVMRAKPQ